MTLPATCALWSRRIRATSAALIAAAAALATIGCAAEPTGRPPAAEQRAIADSLSRQVRAAYDMSTPNAEERLLSLYPPSGRVLSAAGGQIVTTRDSLALGIKAFWENVGANMRQPTWVWDEMVFDVIAPNAAVMTARYRVPHLTPRGMPHTLAGAWTAVFEKRGDRWYVVQEHLSDAPATMDSATARATGSAMAPGTPPMTMPMPAPAKVAKPRKS